MNITKQKNLARDILDTVSAEASALSLRSTFEHFNNNYLFGINRFFGDLYSPLLAEICQVSDEEVINNMGVAHLFGRIFVILQDQLLDEDSTLTPAQKDSYLLALPVVFNKMLASYEKVIDNQSLHTQVQDTLQLVQSENKKEKQLHYTKLNRYEQKEIFNLGKKTSLFSFPALLYGQASLDIKKTFALHAVADKLIVIIQLCDDLADIEDDLKEKNYTHPITEAVITSKSENTSLESVKAGLINHGVLVSILDTVSDLLKEIKTDVNRIAEKETVAEKYFHFFHEHVVSVKEEVRKLNQNISAQELLAFLQKLKDANLDFPHIYPNYHE